ncbi:MAG: hypothetical protein RIM99_10140 [Cyclobacteriaceae bacterium]
MLNLERQEINKFDLIYYLVRLDRSLTTTDSNGEKLYLIIMSQQDADYLQQVVDTFSE